jgi:5-(carboxyamino)imidazole ribonucleotide synthase
LQRRAIRRVFVVPERTDVLFLRLHRLLKLFSLIHTTTIGVLGGGQLGSMLLRSALDFGFQVAILDGNPACTSAPFVRNFTLAAPTDEEGVYAFGKTQEIVTIEMENVSVAALERLEAEGVRVFPQARVIQMIQDKGVQKNWLLQNGFPTAQGTVLSGKEALSAAPITYPMVLKSCRGGYDGQGVMMLRSAADLKQAFEGPSVLEEAIDLHKEISVLVARNEAGEIAVYEPVEMVFKPGKFILDYQLCPAAGIPEETLRTAEDLARSIAQTLEIVGLLAVEMFIDTSGRLLINEMAPRPHNSGHHTIEAVVTSQYEQLLRAICNLPLGSTQTLLPSAMVNFLEPDTTNPTLSGNMIDALLKIPGAHLHWYGKSGGKAGRKMGHVTIALPQMEAVQSTMHQVQAVLEMK